MERQTQEAAHQASLTIHKHKKNAFRPAAENIHSVEQLPKQEVAVAKKSNSFLSNLRQGLKNQKGGDVVA